MTVNAGYWHVRDLQEPERVKVNGCAIGEGHQPGDILSVAKHKYQVNYSTL